MMIARSRRVRLRGGLVVLLLAACDRPATPGASSPGDSAAGARTGASAEAPPASSGWDAAAGAFLVLPTVDGGLVSGSLLRPEATEMTVGDTAGVGAELGAGEVELFSRAGVVGRAQVRVERAPAVDEGCTAWPVARLTLQGAPSVTPWTAAYPTGRLTALPLDSIEGAAPRDSAALVARLAALASALPDDTSGTFRALPFVTLRAWRLRGAEGFVVATLVRRVNQEDDPREERLVLVVDALSDDLSAWRVGWHERAAGREEELVVAEPLLAYRVTGRDGVHLLFGRDDGVALGAAVLVRRGGAWQVQWESAVAGCN